MARRSAVLHGLAVVALAFPAGSSLAAQGTPIHRGFRVTSDVSFRAMFPAGTTRIVAWDRDSIDIVGTLHPGSTFYGGGNGTHAKFGAETRSTSVLAGGDVTIRVPRRARAWVKGTTSVIEVQGIRGELELYAVAGSITVRDGSGVISVESIDAPVTLSRIAGDVRVLGGKGRLRLVDVTGTVSARSVSGAVELSGPRAPEGRIETIGGTIRADYLVYGGATLELQSHAGDMTIVVDRTRRPVLELSSRQGRMPKPTPAGDRAEGRIVARSFRGGINVEFRSGISGMP